jgi:uncharacterized protein (TIGR02246 family)
VSNGDRFTVRSNGDVVTDDDRALLQRLLDIEAIKQLKARYFRSIDRKEWDAFGEVFARDAVLEVPEVDMVTNGRDAIVAFVSGVLAGTQTVHHGHMPEITLTGQDTARGTWAMFDYVEWPSAAPADRIGLQGYGHYVEEYVREDGEWRISRSRLERLRVDPLGGGLPDLDA